jgi:hypothetical protein
MSEPGSLPLATHPSILVRLAVERWGEPGFISLCVALFRTLSWGDEAELMSYVAGRRGPRFVELGLGKEAHWLRVWSLQAMLYAWHPSAVPVETGADPQGPQGLTPVPTPPSPRQWPATPGTAWPACPAPSRPQAAARRGWRS